MTTIPSNPGSTGGSAATGNTPPSSRADAASGPSGPTTPPQDPPPPPNGNGDDATTFVNPQILDAVKQSTTYALGFETLPSVKNDRSNRVSAGGAIAYDKAAQAAALAVQDAADYQRNVLSVSNVAQAKALAMMFADKQNIPQYATIFVLAIAGSLAASVTAGQVGVQMDTMLEKFPRA